MLQPRGERKVPLEGSGKDSGAAPDAVVEQWVARSVDFRAGRDWTAPVPTHWMRIANKQTKRTDFMAFL